VVDSGLSRVAKYDAWSGRASLEVTKISRASAVQRAGRAGRLRAGRALRLYTKGDFEGRPEHDTPEILRADLAEVVLAFGSANVANMTEIRWLDAPPPSALQGAEQLLHRLGAVDGEGKLTPLGKRMAQFAAPPRLSKLIVEAALRGAAREGCIVAAMLAEGRDVYARSWDATSDGPAGADEPCDLCARLARIEEATAGGFDRQRARHLGLVAESVLAITKAADQYLRMARAAGIALDVAGSETTDHVIRRALLAAFPDRVAQRRQAKEDATRLGVSRELLLASGGTAILSETSVVRTAPWLVAVEAGDRGGVGPRRTSFPAEKRQTRVWLASAIEPEWLIGLYPGAVGESVEVSWSEERERVEAFERLTFERLILDERPAGSAADEAAAHLLADRVLAVGIDAFGEGDAYARLTRRLEFVVKEAPDLAERAGLSLLDPASLRLRWLPLLAGKRSFAEIRNGSIMGEIRAAVGHAQLARLDELAPEQITLGGGRRVKVHYEANKAPWIESRLQDFFGSSRTPRILADRVPLVLHLLAPNNRDVQVTTDLAGFWARTYPGVRNELMRRYPRHAWPSDPLSARPPEPRTRGKRT
jgi:ATP-dependent helicase HrpB